MPSKLTRRQLAAAVAAPVLLAQTPAPLPIPQNADDELKAVRAQNLQIAEALEKFPLPMTTEPATHFKA